MVFYVFWGLYRFVVRYQCLSITCLDLSTAWVQCLSIACPKIEHLDPTALIGVMGGGIYDIAPMGQFLDTPVIGGFGANFGQVHGLFPINMKGFPEQFVVP